MASLAGNRLYVVIYPLILVQSFSMAIRTGNLLCRVYYVIIGQDAAFDDMLLSGMTCGALKIQLSHVYVLSFRWEN